MKVLIVGAGIGGLTSAICLLRAGYDVQLFERSAELQEVGAGVQLGANALCVLQDLGLLKDLQACSIAPECVEFREFDTGKVLHKVEWGSSYQQRTGLPYLHVYRADLQAILVSALNDLNPHVLKLNATVVDFSEDAGGVTLQLASGEEISGDCLIAADGVKSLLRKKILTTLQQPNSPAEFSGYVAWRGMIPVEKLPQDFMPKMATNFVGPDKHMVMYYLRQQQLLNFVGVVKKPNFFSDSVANSKNSDSQNNAAQWTFAASKQELKRDFQGWYPMVQSLIDVVDESACEQWALFDYAAVRKWSTPRASLLGDAAHACLPFMASGASMAIEDAKILTRAFQECNSVSAALQCYQKNRISRTAKVQQRSRQAGQVFHLKNRLARHSAFKLLSLRASSADDWLVRYNPNQVPLNLN